ncbi:MAG: YoaK family protein [Phyllobacterium sp.]
MLIQVGEARNGNVDRRLASTLAAIAGALNAAAFHAVGFFSANMTGNVSLLSDHIGMGDFSSAIFVFAIVASFVAGAALSTLLVNAGRRRHVNGIYAYSILLEATLLVALGFVDLQLLGSQRVVTLVLSLSFLMGLQNAVVTRISDARVRTTHVSGMATDIGIGIGMLYDMKRGAETQAAADQTLAKLILHVQTVFSFFLGGIAGVLAYREFGGFLLFGVAAILFAIAIPAALRSRGRKTEPPPAGLR